VRWKNDDQLLIISNFEEKPCQFQLKIDAGTIEKLKLKPGSYKLVDKLTGRNDMVLVVNESGIVDVNLSGLESVILEIE
jgi:hypothetical protein